MHKATAKDSKVLLNQVIFSQDIYCGGYSGEDPPLPIPNREVKLTIADGPAPPGGRVGSCHALNDTLSSFDDGVFRYILLLFKDLLGVILSVDLLDNLGEDTVFVEDEGHS